MRWQASSAGVRLRDQDKELPLGLADRWCTVTWKRHPVTLIVAESPVTSEPSESDDVHDEYREDRIPVQHEWKRVLRETGELYRDPSKPRSEWKKKFASVSECVYCGCRDTWPAAADDCYAQDRRARLPEYTTRRPDGRW